MTASQCNKGNKSLLQWKGIPSKRKDYMQPRIIQFCYLYRSSEAKISGESYMKNRRKYSLFKLENIFKVNIFQITP